MRNLDGRLCSEHQVPLIYERGGDDMPTIHGRWYCPHLLRPTHEGSRRPGGEVTASPLQHRRTGRLRRMYKMWKFNNEALAAQRRRDEEINRLIKDGRKAAKKAAKQP